jgi:transcriptional regulator with XRE-family HTH domain
MPAEVKLMPTIKELRVQHGLTQFELAVKVGVTPSTVYTWEKRRRKPNVDHLRRLAEFFGVAMEEIEFEESGGDGVE